MERIVSINIIGYAMVCHGLRQNSRTKRIKEYVESGVWIMFEEYEEIV